MPKGGQQQQQDPTPQKTEGLQSFVISHHVSFSVTLSLILVVSGLVFVLAWASSTGLPVVGSLGITIASMELRLLFGALGVCLLAGALFLNRFVFDALNYERALRIRAQKSTREAQLLQDILTHDVRNFNQVSKLSAELLAEEVQPPNKDTQMLLDKLLQSIDGSTLLVDRAKMLGKVISDYELDLRPVNALLSMNRSMELILNAYPKKKVSVAVKLPTTPLGPLQQLNMETQAVDVMADDLLDEIFANLFSNSVKYSDAEEVFIGIECQKVHDPTLKKNCWKISLSDTGKGIPDELKRSLFSRYLEGAKGSGLGMSIVHALVVERYHGRIEVTDRVRNDHSKGTLIELIFPASY